MINATNTLGKDNPRWPVSNAPETIKVPATGPPERSPDAGDAIRRAAGIVAAWLAGLPRRAGRRLFAMNDLEARWRGWQVTETAGGLGRQYRDWRFDSLGSPGRAPRAGGMAPPAPPRPAIPEAWDDHWDGRPLEGER